MLVDAQAKFGWEVEETARLAAVFTGVALASGVYMGVHRIMRGSPE